MTNLQDRVVMITGASSGIGLATAKLLAREGARLVLGARRLNLIQQLANDLGGPSRAIAIQTDVTKNQDVLRLAEEGIKAFGQIDSLINNAGVAHVSPLIAGKIDDWNNMIDVNIRGVLHGINAVLKHMQERGSGQIINVCSVSGHSTSPTFTVYCATKHAVKAISDGLRQETSGEIQVTNISPGIFETEILKKGIDERLKEKMANFLDLAESPEHVAEVISYALKQDPRVAINELTIRPTMQ